MSKRRLIITSVISIILVSVLLIGSTYSVFTSESVDENANVYTTGVLDVTYTVSSDNIKLEDATPIADSDNIYIKPYRLNITNNGSVPYKFNIILNNTTATTSIDTNYIMTQVGKLDPVVLGTTTNNIIKSDVVVEANSSVDVDVRVYIKEDIPNSEIGKNFSATLSIDGLAVYNDSGVINNDELIANYVSVNVPIANYIQNLYSSSEQTSVTTTGGESITQASSVGLMQDSFGNIRYYGASPNNYVTFNGEEAGWRIIGVFDVEDENGNIEKRVRLIRDESIGTYAYDNKPSGTGTSTTAYGSNDWTDARLMMLLNPGYETTSTLYAYEGSLYWNSKSGTCYSGSSEGTTSCDFTSTGLTDEGKSMIGKAKYYLGGSSTVSGLYADDYYNFERGTTVYSGHATEWTGYVGIMYPSDYAYAADLSLCTKDPHNYESDTTNCTGTDWLFNSANQWTIAPYSSDAYSAFRVYSSGYVARSNVYIAIGVRPVVVLESKVTIVSGEGTSDNPYKLSLEGSDDTEGSSTYTISYDANGGSGAPVSQSIEEGSSVSVSSTTPTRSGYTFLGWSTDSSATTATYAAGATFSVEADTTLYAVWQINTYTISYNANGGSGAPASQTKTYGENITLSTTVPTRTGYTFLGWSTSSTATTATYQPGGAYSTNASVALYAVWQHLSTTLVTGTTLKDTIPTTATSIVFTDDVASSGTTLTDVSSAGDGGVVMWNSGTTYYISTQRDGIAVMANEDSSYMFDAKTSLTSINLTNLNTSNAMYMQSMFRKIGYDSTTFSFVGLSGLDTSSVTNIDSMFSYAGYSASTFDIDLSSWDTSSVTGTGMSNVFSYAGYSATTFVVDLSGWDTSAVTNMSYMFYGAGRNATTKWSLGGLSGWDMSSVTDTSYMFNNAGRTATTFSIGNLSGWNTSSVTNMRNMFSYTGYSATYSLNCSGWNVNKVTTYDYFNYGVESKVTAPTWVN